MVTSCLTEAMSCTETLWEYADRGVVDRQYVALGELEGHKHENSKVRLSWISKAIGIPNSGTSV
jgi:hypothetical protein